MEAKIHPSCMISPKAIIAKKWQMPSKDCNGIYKEKIAS